MTLIVALRCRDGLVFAADGKVTRASTAHRTKAQIWQRAGKVHVVPPGVVVAGAGEVAFVHEVVETLRDADETVRAEGLDGVIGPARDALVALRTEAVERYKALYGDDGIHHAPRAYLLLAEADPEPRVVYMSEDGDVEDQTHLGYAVVGSGDLTVHIRMETWDPERLTVDQGAVLAYGLVRDVVTSGAFHVSDPVRLWTLVPGEPPRALEPDEVARVAERHRDWRRRVHAALEEV